VMNDDGAFPLFFASLNESVSVINLLFKYNANMSLFQKDSKRYSSTYSYAKEKCEKLQRGEIL
jgi:hypothetical protein